MRCSCGETFTPTAETYAGTQVCRDDITWDAWLILILHNCPACFSTRTIVMHDATGDADEHLEPIAAE